MIGILIVGRHGHETGDLEARKGEELIPCGAERVGREAELGFLARDIDFNADARPEVEIRCDAIHLHGDVDVVDAVEEREVGKGFANFVRLKMADEVPLGRVREKGDFWKGFLDAAFAEEGLALVKQFADFFRRIFF